MPAYQPNQTTTCPHCRVAVRLEAPTVAQQAYNWILAQSDKETSQLTISRCPNCLRHLVALDHAEVNRLTGKPERAVEHLVWPRATARPPVPTPVPAHVAEDYTEAAAVLPLSPKASAALSRRCLQAVLRESAGTKSKDLSGQIDEVLASLPSNIASNLDAIRAVGNFAAHPTKCTHTGDIIEVEPGEAEWNLDVLDALFDFYYVRPEIEKKKREELNKKLQDAGKSPLK